ncbi:tol-pal system protein YbgF [uncultured Marinobacter sp.]|uniref:tol-pal system protein YbgF n=1 Tax=uncultured Marinobacter sp. TaxID=187379 RepID=UPI0030DD21E0
MKKWLLTVLALSVSGGVIAQSSTPAFQNNQSEARRQTSGNQANSELFFMVERLRNEVRDLRGQLEEQQNQLERLSRQSRERYIDLDQRILELSERPAAAAGGSARTQQPAPAQRAPAQRVMREYRQPSQAEREAYGKIQTLIQQERDYDEAINQLYDFISEYPEGDLTVNAYYWLGVVYLVKPQLEQARQAFTIVATRFADHRKASDALYKLGVAYDRDGEKDEARRHMERVVREYGTSEAAALAKKYLAEG